jgi:hypothetical protein
MSMTSSELGRACLSSWVVLYAMAPVATSCTVTDREPAGNRANLLASA